MITHEPKGYKCPLCYIAQGKEEPDFPYTRQADVVYRDEFLTAFVASHWWPKNKAHVIVIPNLHHENIYDIPADLLGKIAQFSQHVSRALKATYRCDGVTTRQHNEPAGNQDVWHYHLHVYPRYTNDQFYETTYQATKSDPKDRAPFVEKLRGYFNAM